MLAAGTGIAPMVQVILHILDNEQDETFIHLLYSCKQYDNILAKNILDASTSYWNFSCTYVLSQVSNNGKLQMVKLLGYIIYLPPSLQQYTVHVLLTSLWLISLGDPCMMYSHVFHQNRTPVIDQSRSVMVTRFIMAVWMKISFSKKWEQKLKKLWCWFVELDHLTRIWLTIQRELVFRKITNSNFDKW